ncbi:MAG: RNA methyltransferase [Spirochaetes bacterium]|nr:RNA methyltransferase [Spirochaetota bacterium]MBU1081777.1 RNA methyltransferase [Spirochaetota bacterium]
MATALDDVAVVLCRAEGSMNVGASCRAMKSMGVTRLVLARCPEYDEAAVRTHALLAFDLFEAAERYESLGEALSGFSLAAGFTRRVGQRRKENVAVEDLAEACSRRGGGPIALVFGNERDGLSDAELSLCDEAVGISSSELFPSLNLSHAVQIACWEIRKSLSRRAGHEDGLANGRAAAPRASTEAAAIDIADALQAAGFFKIAGRPEAEAFIRSVAARAALSESELGRFSSLFVKLGALSASALDRGASRE